MNGEPWTEAEDEIAVRNSAQPWPVKLQLLPKRSRGAIRTRLQILGQMDGPRFVDYERMNKAFVRVMKKMAKAHPKDQRYRQRKPVVREPDGRSVQYQPEPRSFGNSCLNDAG